jgi:hypothetical protein
LNSTEIVLTYNNPSEEIQGTETLLSLKRKADKVTGGDTRGMETILISQAVALDAEKTIRGFQNLKPLKVK